MHCTRYRVGGWGHAVLITFSGQLRLMLDRLEHYLSGKILQFLERPTVRYAPFFAPDPSVVRAALQPGDILLVEGNTRLASIIKFLTQST